MADGEKTNVEAAGAPPIVTTQPEKILRHNISDEELSELSRMRSDHVVEIFWGTLGVVLGTFLPFSDALGKVLSEEVMTRREFFHVGLFFIAACLCLYTAFLWRNRARRSNTLEDRIRSRPQGLQH
jgi:hypothetical protein